MLIILSDIHLTDGTASRNVNPEAFSILRREITHHAGDKKAQEIHLVLLGDIFDLVRTDWWFDPSHVAPEDRPWNGTIDPATGMNEKTGDVEAQFQTVLERTLAHRAARSFLRAIRGLVSTRQRRPVRVTYVVGNHDRAFHQFPRLQARLQQCLPEVPLTFVGVLQAPEYGVCARHGHEWDDDCNARWLRAKVFRRGRLEDPLDPGIYPVMALGEVITAELISGLVYRIRQTGNAALAEAIQGLDHLRPATEVFSWLEWQAHGRPLTAPDQALLSTALIDSISGVVDSAFGRLWDRIQPDLLATGDLIDRLQLVRAALRARGLAGLRECARFFAALGHYRDSLRPQPDAYYQGARTEFARLPDTLQFLVQGHTHQARHDYLSANIAGGVRLYINTGTFLPLVQRTDDGRGFARAHQMTMAFFYHEGEDLRGKARPGPTLDLWYGIKCKEYREPPGA
jgi:UDP-2,3-diacylglucosamine pyrophosphatase LpxH